MSTDEAVTGYERVLGLPPGTLTGVLEQARIERHGDAWAKRRVHIPVEFAPPEPVGAEPSGKALEAESPVAEQAAPPTPPRRARWWTSRRVVIASSVAMLALVGLVVGLLASQPKTSARTAASISGVEDGKDPSVTGCAADGVTVDSVNVYDPPEHLVGVLQLRSSPRCGTSWPRFMPTSALATTPKITLELDVYRPADGGSAKFRVTYDGLAAYGNMLLSSHQCVYAQVTLIRQGQSSLPPVQTGCRKSPSG
jgi:hypothetical protein